MFDIKADFKNKEVLIKTKNMADLTMDGVRKGFYELGKLLKKESVALINKKPKSGRLYSIVKNGIRTIHQASAPGEAPAVITGRLRASVDFEVSGSNTMTFGAKNSVTMRASTDVVSTGGSTQHVIDYPKYLEDGTMKMAARPFLKPAIENNYRNAEVIFEKQIEKSVTK